jgi:hypothetical protein
MLHQNLLRNNRLRLRKKEGRRPGGQLGHQGKTRKGFGQIDRSEFLRAETIIAVIGRRGKGVLMTSGWKISKRG